MIQKVPKIRLKAKEKRKLHKSIESTLLQENDDRVYLRVQIGEENVSGLVDSGANITCLGKGALEFLARNNLKITPMDATLRTAGGNSKLIVGFVRSLINYRSSSFEFNIFVAPDLVQPLYHRVDFIKVFNLAISLLPKSQSSQQ